MSIPTMTPPKPFKVDFAKSEFNELQHRLKTARLPHQALIPDAPNRAESHPLKPDLPWLKSAIAEWQKMDYDTVMAKYNKFDHFTTSIDWCTQLHFVHKRSSRPDAIPIVLVHGWPGSWYEFGHVIDQLAEPEDKDAPAFHVVVPSLPGFVFSSAPPSNAPGVGDFVGYVRIIDALMRGLGYEKYASQGGDWGSPHARALGALHSHADGTGCRAVHLNFCPVSPSGITKALRNTLPTGALLALAKYVYDEEHLEMIKKAARYESNSCYYVVQRDRPAQLSYGLVDSPIGLLGWLGYFYDIMTEANPTHPTLNIKDLLETATLFHMTRSIGTSFLPYANNPYLPDIHAAPEYKLSVPLGYSSYPDEIINTPRAYVDKTVTSGKTTWIAKATKGGHFAALEEPAVFISHLRNAFAPQGRWKGHETDGILDPQIQGGLWDQVRRSSPGASYL